MLTRWMDLSIESARTAVSSPRAPRPAAAGAREVTLTDAEIAAVEAALAADPDASDRMLSAATGITRGRLGPYLQSRQVLHAVA
ncbi:hypothetical protein [Cellulomonas phragmiteti]|uniref:Uncharacterized protein n=1 Tax=Cellulomonas phragmiteti TaxID=478780 RepID=A0ABQ4DP29_9CELL|nr:hypothetical protein [Cellulomonas phragmiteti]GIG41117.1 hypothetical protein Cph01nite_28790 [Cellulomonas phragmiteti]